MEINLKTQFKMKIKTISAIAFSLIFITFNGFAQLTIDSVISKSKILVIAHRGDWRNAPENSIPGLKSCIAMGVDVMEIDLKKTKDGHLIVMHDNTIDRSTNGKGKPGDYTLAEIKKFQLKNGLGRPTNNTIPTFKEFMLAARGKIIVEVDKADGYYKEINEVLENTGTLNQTLVKTYYPLQKCIDKNGLTLMQKFHFVPILNLDKPETYKDYLAYQNSEVKPIAYELCFATDTARLLNNPKMITSKGARICVNAMWDSLSGGHSDDEAVEEKKPDENWGWLIAKGATIIQTDRPKELLEYLRGKGLHQ